MVTDIKYKLRWHVLVRPSFPKIIHKIPIHTLIAWKVLHDHNLLHCVNESAETYEAITPPLMYKRSGKQVVVWSRPINAQYEPASWTMVGMPMDWKNIVWDTRMCKPIIPSVCRFLSDCGCVLCVWVWVCVCMWVFLCVCVCVCVWGDTWKFKPIIILLEETW